MSGFILRRFAAEDAAPLLALWVASWNATLPEIDFSERRDWFVEWLRSHLAANGLVICAISAEAAPPLPGPLPPPLAGGAAGGLEPTAAFLGFVGISPITGHMEQIAVAPTAFGQGIGKVLLDAAKRVSPAGITLRVNRENPRAVAFYRREGFIIVAEGVNPGGTRRVFDMAWRP